MPPTVRKQTPTPPPRTNGQTQTSRSSGLLGRVTPVSRVDSGGLKVSLYGRPKTGKTRLLSTFPKPLLILGSEDGTRSIRDVDGVNFIRIVRHDKDRPEDGSYVYLRELGDLLRELPASEYNTVGLDNASALSDMILADLLGIEEIPAQKSWGMASREQYGQQSLQLRTILRELLSLRQHVVVIAHERNFNEDGGGSDLITPTVGSALSQSVTNWLNGHVEYVCQTFIREASETLTTKIGAKEVATQVKTGKKEYCLRTGPHSVYMTGFRVPGNVALPEAIVNPHYDKIMALVNGKVK